VALLACAASASADGGRLRAHEDAGPFRVAIFTAPEPLTAGPADISVLVQDGDGGHTILHGEVTLELTGPDGSVASARAGRHARNRLFYGATLDLQRGTWTVTARVRRGSAEGVTRASFEVGAAGARSFDPWPYLSIPPLAVVLYAANRGLRNRERRRRMA
jgi:hypothetical protein